METLNRRTEDIVNMVLITDSVSRILLLQTSDQET